MARCKKSGENGRFWGEMQLVWGEKQVKLKCKLKLKKVSIIFVQVTDVSSIQNKRPCLGKSRAINRASLLLTFPTRGDT